MNDLFGHPITKQQATARPSRPKKTGHAAAPGSGPKDMQCRNCAHLIRSRMRSSKVFMKCALMRHAWTRGAGSDIKAGDQACNRFLHHDSQP